MKADLGLVTLLAGTLVGHAQVTREFAFPVGRDIPDGDLSGLADSRILRSLPVPILSVAVTLKLTPIGQGGFLGDLYLTLMHEGGGYAVLLNRPGKRPGSLFGYSDGVGLDITLADDAEADIHQYRLTLNGSHTEPLDSDLTGRWLPDGRAVDPLVVVPTDSRLALLDSFGGSDLAGRWTLFAADVSGEGSYRLDSWGLAVSMVPEPRSAAVVFGILSALGVAIVRQRSARG